MREICKPDPDRSDSSEREVELNDGLETTLEKEMQRKLIATEHVLTIRERIVRAVFVTGC